MRIKLDENMPAALAESLRDLGHDVHTVPEEGLAGYVDPEIWAAAQRESDFLLPKIWTSRTLHSLHPAHMQESC